jgi:hypothetical protein
MKGDVRLVRQRGHMMREKTEGKLIVHGHLNAKKLVTNERWDVEAVLDRAP